MTIGIGSLQENFAHRKIRESLLGSAGLGRCTSLSNQFMFGLSNQQAGSYAPATELVNIRFRYLPFWEIVWHLSTKVNDSDPAAYITVFGPIRGKRRCFIHFLVYALVYLSISSNLVFLVTLSPSSDSVRMHTRYPFFRKTLSR